MGVKTGNCIGFFSNFLSFLYSRNISAFKKLSNLRQRVMQLEKQVRELSEKKEKAIS